MSWNRLHAALLAVLGACAHDVHARYPAAPGASTATLVLRFTGAVDDTYVSVNGVLVAEDAHTREIVVEGVPAGQTTVVVAAGGGMEKAFTLDLQAGRRVVVPLSAADTSVGKTLLQAFLTAAVYAVYFALF